MEDGRDARYRAPDMRQQHDMRAIIRRVKYRPIQLRLVTLAVIALGASGCATFGEDRPKPAKTTGPPDRSSWFLPADQSPPEPTETIAGRAGVLSGDTLEVDDAVVVLSGIDAPEPAQRCRRESGLPYRCGEDMTALLEQRLQRDRVTCEVALLESGVYTGVCRHYGANLNEWMVRQGYAVANNVDSPYVDIEREAALAGRGLWAGIFERPSDWRERND